MTGEKTVREVLSAIPRKMPAGIRNAGIVMVAVGTGGLALGFGAAGAKAGWTALLTATVMVIGVAAAGVLLSAIFQLTGARWGRAYRRIAEGSVALMPVGVLGILVVLAGGSAYLPWAHEGHLTGGKNIWLVRGFWDARVLGVLLVIYGLSLAFVYHSVRKDFCLRAVREGLAGKLADFLGKGLSGDDAREAARLDARMTLMAPAIAILYGLGLTLLAVDLIMALEPDWFSTLFGGWYFIGQLFTCLALVAILGILLRRRFGLERFISVTRQSDAATLLLAFSLLAADFFWSQYLTIWYGNLPEETMWVIARTASTSPLRGLSWATLASFFAIPFFALLFRKVKQTDELLAVVAVVVVSGILMSRFIEIAPALMDLHGPGASYAIPLISSAATFVGLLGAGLLIFFALMARVPVMCVGDSIFADVFDSSEEAP